MKLFLEHNLFKSVSKWVTFLWQTQIQMIKYGFDTKGIKRNKLHWYFIQLHPLASNNFDAQNDFGKNFVTKNLLSLTILTFSML